MRSRILSAAVVCILVNGGLGCRTRGVADAGQDAGVVDAGPHLPPELAVTLDNLFEDGGTEHLELFAGRPQELSPSQHLTVLSNRPLRNARVRIFDESDRALESDDRALEDADAGIRYEISLLAPLKPGHRYALMLDAQDGLTMVDDQGRALPEQRFDLQALGERVKDAPAGKPHRRRR